MSVFCFKIRNHAAHIIGGEVMEFVEKPKQQQPIAQRVDPPRNSAGMVEDRIDRARIERGIGSSSRPAAAGE